MNLTLLDVCNMAYSHLPKAQQPSIMKDNTPAGLESVTVLINTQDRDDVEVTVRYLYYHGKGLHGSDDPDEMEIWDAKDEDGALVPLAMIEDKANEAVAKKMQNFRQYGNN